METRVGLIVAYRRKELGLSTHQLATFSFLSETMLGAIEEGKIDDVASESLSQLLMLLGLAGDPPTTSARQRKRGLQMAARNTSVSYKHQLSVEDLRSILTTGTVPKEAISNVVHFLEETPLALVILAVEESVPTALERKIVWHNIEVLAKKFHTLRAEMRG